jgi:hypothetical protein
MFSRRQTCRGKSQSPVVWIAEEMETKPSKPIDKVSSGEATRFCCKDLGLVTDHPREDEMTSQAATWNSPVMNSAWALMSLLPMFRTCPFLIIAIAS